MMMMMMQQVDPLSNHVILETIFKNLDVPDLKAVRLVSSLWTEASLDTWRKTAVLVLKTPDDDDGGGGEGGGGDHHLTFSEFQEMTRRSEGGGGDEYACLKLGRKPFSKYKLVGWKFEKRESEEEQKLHFIRDHGSLMEYLHLEHCSFRKFSIFDALLRQSLPNLRKLVWSSNRITSLNRHTVVGNHFVRLDDSNGLIRAGNHVETVFSHFQERHSSRRGHFQRSLKALEICCSEDKVACRCESWTKLFSSMPAVEDVTLRIYNSDDFKKGSSSLGYLLDALKVVNRLHGGSKIRKLDLLNFYIDGCSRSGIDYNYKPDDDKILDLPALEELSVDLVSCSSHLIALMLENVSDTLQVLKGFCWAPISKILDLLPLPELMDSLRELYLFGNVTENLCFLRHTPNLKVLVMNQFHCFEQRHKLEGGKIPAEGPYVRFCATDLVSNTETTLLLVKISEPSLIVNSLEYLDVDYPVSAAAVPTLARWMPNVTTVKMVMDNNEILSATCKAWPKLEEIECLYASKVDDNGISSLIQCSELRKFKMNSLCGQATLTSSSLDDFIKIDPLRELSISILDQVSEEAEATLLDKLRDLKLIKNHHNHNNLEYECCERSPFLQKVFDLVVKPAPKAKQSGEVPVIVGGPLAPRTLRSGRILRPQ